MMGGTIRIVCSGDSHFIRALLLGMLGYLIWFCLRNDRSILDLNDTPHIRYIIYDRLFI